MLAKTRQANIGQPLDGFQKVVHARLDISVQAEVLPKFVHFQKCARLRVLAIFPLKKVAQNAEIALVTDDGSHFEVGRGGRLVGKKDPLPVIGNGNIFEFCVRLFIVKIIVFESSFAPASEVQVEIRADSCAAPLTIIKMQDAIELVVQEPIIAAEQEGPEAAAVTGNETQIACARAQIP